MKTKERLGRKREEGKKESKEVKLQLIIKQNEGFRSVLPYHAVRWLKAQ